MRRGRGRGRRVLAERGARRTPARRGGRPHRRGECQSGGHVPDLMPLVECSTTRTRRSRRLGPCSVVWSLGARAQNVGASERHSLGEARSLGIAAHLAVAVCSMFTRGAKVRRLLDQLGARPADEDHPVGVLLRAPIILWPSWTTPSLRIDPWSATTAMWSP
jgi:hypothetical protein